MIGTTDTPEIFSLDIARPPLRLRTSFAATVDGTNGRVRIAPGHALLGDSAFEVSGSIARNAPGTHKEIDLKASAGKTGLDECLLRLAVKSPRPPMTGTIAFNATVKIPPGEKPVVDRLQLDGRFTLNRVRFTSVGRAAEDRQSQPPRERPAEKEPALGMSLRISRETSIFGTAIWRFLNSRSRCPALTSTCMAVRPSLRGASFRRHGKT